jgi:4-hydroxy-3-methylbut-2-en-1-yl diphosphate synthase IspG/GcpE
MARKKRIIPIHVGLQESGNCFSWEALNLLLVWELFFIKELAKHTVSLRRGDPVEEIRVGKKILQDFEP